MSTNPTILGYSCGTCGQWVPIDEAPAKTNAVNTVHWCAGYVRSFPGWDRSAEILGELRLIREQLERLLRK